MGTMPKPTQAALQRKPMAIILLAAKAEAPDTVADYDYEWFETAEGRAEFLAGVQAWAAEDVATHGDIVHYIVDVKDTSLLPASLGIDSVQAFAKDDIDPEVLDNFVQSVKDTPLLAVAPSAQRKTGAAPAATRKVKAQVKGRKASTAAQVVKGVVEDGNAPKPKAAKARKAVKAAAPKDVATAKDAPAPKDARAAALKKRLAAKQDAKAEPETVPNLGWAVPIGRNRRGRFVRVH